jgi:hypothetical protein
LLQVSANAPKYYCDALGALHAPAHRISNEPARIACFVPSITELLCDLGLDNHLVARTAYCIHPAAKVASIPALGGTKKFSLSRLQRLAPTHAVVNIDENTQVSAAQLREFVPHVVVTHPLTMADNFSLFELMGGIFAREQAAQLLSEQLSRELSQLQQRRAITQRPLTVLYVIWKDPWMTVTTGTYIADCLAQIGCEVTLPLKMSEHPSSQMSSCATAIRYPQFSFESLDWCGVDAVLLSSEPYSFKANDQQTVLTEVAKFAGRPVPVLLVDGELMSWYGSRAVKTPAYLASLRLALDQALRDGSVT